MVFSSDTSLLFWELLLFCAVVVAFCVGFTAALESAPFWWHGWWHDRPPTAAALTTNRMVSDWFVGQWAWFIAFAGYSCLVSLLGEKYLDVYSSILAWWLLDLAVLLGYVGYAMASPCGCNLPARAAGRIGGLALFSALRDPEHLDRQGTMLTRSVSWLLGIGLYFTLKITFPVFRDSLSLESVDTGELAAYVAGTTVLCFLGIFLLELFRQHLAALEHSVWLRSPRGAPRWRHQRPMFKLIEAVEVMLKLVFCYISGKAFEAAALADHGADGGGTLNFALLGLKWQLAAGVAAVVASAWDLKTQRRHGDDHSTKCVCTVCHPEYYGAA